MLASSSNLHSQQFSSKTVVLLSLRSPHNDQISVMLTDVNQNSASAESADGRRRTILPTLAEK
jgi:hypothetical protein